MGCRGCGKSKKEFKKMVDGQVKLGSEVEAVEESKVIDPIQELKNDIDYLKRIKKGEYLNKLLKKKEAILEKMQKENK